MVIEIPADWPVRSWVEDTPLAHLETIDSEPASGVVPTRWYVSEWSSTREIKASTLPGQVRHQSGLSIGTGKALVKRQPNDFPWKHSLVFELTGQDARILLAPRNSTGIPTGQFQVAEISGDLTTRGVQVDLDEKIVDGTDQTPGVLDQQWASDITQVEINAQVKDPVWLVSELAEQMGFRAGPNVTPGVAGYTPILDVPLQGALLPRQPLSIPFSTTDTLSWGSSQGSAGLSTAGDSSITVTYEVADVLVPVGYSITMDTNNGWATMEWDDILTNGRIGIQVKTTTGSNLVDLNIYSTGSNGVSNTSTLNANISIPRDADTPNRVQVEVTLNPVSATGYDSASVRIRRQDGFWFGPYVHSMTNQLSRVNEHVIEMGLAWLSAGNPIAFLSNFSVIDNGAVFPQTRDVLLNTIGGSQGRIYLEPLVGTITSPWLDPDLSVWSTMRAIVEAWQGALITDVYGDLKVLNRLTLAGLNSLQQEPVIQIGTRFEDLPWRMVWSDQADRLVIKYRPVVEVKADPSQTGLPSVYEFQDIIIAYPGGNDAFFTLYYIYPTDLKLIPFIRKDSDNLFYHVWDAYRYNNGSGAHINPGSDIGMRIDRVTSATWKVYIDNQTASPFHMVDNTGTPWLKIRSSWYYDQTREETITRGVDASDAKSAIEIDLGHYVQNAADANTLADFIWGRTNQRAWKASTVNAVPDYSRDLGDVVELQHARTGVRSNAIVTKVDMAGKPGSVTQKLDLTLIPPTWEDFDEAWASSTWNAFDALWNAYTWTDFDRTPTATTVAQIEEAM